MKSTVMNSGLHLRRVLLLVFVFFVLSIAAIAQPKLTLNFGPNGTAGIADLRWGTDDLITMGIYNIERQASSSLGTWKVLTTIPYGDVLTSNEFKDTISYPYCSTPINPSYNFSYRIHFTAFSGLEAFSLPTTDIALSDQTSPAEVKNLNVNLVPVNMVYYPRITWDRITDDSIQRYDIQQTVDINVWGAVIGWVPDDSSGFNDKTDGAGCGSSFKYIVLAYDRCGHRSSPLYDQYVQPINIDLKMPVQCDKAATLTWNSNNSLPGGISGFKIMRSIGSTYDEIGSVNSMVTSFVDTRKYKDGVLLGYSIKAFSNNSAYTSSSCHPTQLYEAAFLPDTVYITNVSVENDSYIKIGYYISAENSVTRLILERSSDNGTNYHAVDSISSPVPTSSFFSDTAVDVHAHSYYYRLVAIDDCSSSKKSMNVSKSILLKCEPIQTMNTLNWNSYESWIMGVAGYDIYRILNKEPATIQIINSAGAYTNSYSDLLTSIDSTKIPCYWVEAKENPGNPYMQNAISKSNTCCIVQEPIIFLPNAFRPDGINKFFRPVQSPRFIQIESFKMTIFNRWGQQIFETSDIVNGWNGTINGNEAPTGLYSYIVTFKSLDDKEYTKRGTVTLVR